MVLAVTPRLGTLVAEAGRCVPGLERQRRSVLNPRPHDRRRALGPQREMPSTLVLEVVHLLAHHVGRFADALEDADVLEYGTDHEPVAGPADPRREQRDQTFPPR